MLPPVLEIFVVWHPSDQDGLDAANQFVDHFHGTLFSGLIGGAVEVYIRSEGWRGSGDAPRPIPFPDDPPPNGTAQAQFTAVVPVLGNEFAAAVELGDGAWFEYADRISRSQLNHPERVAVFPLQIDAGAAYGTRLGELFSRFQQIATPAAYAASEPIAELRCRDLSQGIAQFASAEGIERLIVFLSHTKRVGPGEGSEVAD